MRGGRITALVSGTVILSLSSVGQAVITDDLVRHYKMDEAAGATAAVDAQGIKNLTQDQDFPLDNGLPTPGAAGKIGNAWDFEADNRGILDEGDDVWGGFFNVAASMWVNPESLDAGLRYTLMSEDSSTVLTNKDAFLQIVDQGKLQWTLELGGATFDVITTDSAVISTGSWQHVAVVLESAVATIYVNGSEVKSQAVTGNTVDAVNDLMIGGVEDNPAEALDPFDGRIDDIGVWNRALSADEVFGIYYAGNQGQDLSQAIALHPGDANSDGMVNLADLQILGDNWQSTTATWATADFTGDGNVNLADLQILGDNWGFGTSPDITFDEALAAVTIPEPATATLSLLTLGGLLLQRRRTVVL